jgi:hypothetical protein
VAAADDHNAAARRGPQASLCRTGSRQQELPSRRRTRSTALFEARRRRRQLRSGRVQFSARAWLRSCRCRTDGASRSSKDRRPPRSRDCTRDVGAAATFADAGRSVRRPGGCSPGAPLGQPCGLSPLRIPGLDECLPGRGCHLSSGLGLDPGPQLSGDQAGQSCRARDRRAARGWERFARTRGRPGRRVVPRARRNGRSRRGRRAPAGTANNSSWHCIGNSKNAPTS